MDSTSTDRELVRAVLAGDRDAFAPLVARHRRAAILCATAIAGPDAAEDIAQDAFVRTYTHLASCRDHDRFGGWLLATVRHLALNHLRAARRRPTVALPPDLSLATASHDVVLAERQRLWNGLTTLAATEREVLLLADLEQLAHAEIARRVGVSVFMSRRHLSKARQKLRDFLRSPHGE